jgi:hypothetical protein
MKLFSQKDAADFAKSGVKEFRFSRESTRMTPGARDVLVAAGVKIVYDANAGAVATPAPAAPKSGDAAKTSTSAPAASKADILALFNSPLAKKLKDDLVEIGSRCWKRDYNDGNGGNISARLGNYFLCTPTGVSKGFMKPDMICLVDIEGNQLAGNAPWKRTSEILSHLGIYKTVPTAAAVVHAHPIHATAFAMAGIEPPRCLIPEVEVFVGTIPVAEYKTPGSPQRTRISRWRSPTPTAAPSGSPASCRPSAPPSRPTRSKSCSTSKRNSACPTNATARKPANSATATLGSKLPTAPSPAPPPPAPRPRKCPTPNSKASSKNSPRKLWASWGRGKFELRFSILGSRRKH